MIENTAILEATTQTNDSTPFHLSFSWSDRVRWSWRIISDRELKSGISLYATRGKTALPAPDSLPEILIRQCLFINKSPFNRPKSNPHNSSRLYIISSHAYQFEYPSSHISYFSVSNNLKRLQGLKIRADSPFRNTRHLISLVFARGPPTSKGGGRTANMTAKTKPHSTENKEILS